jgi:D-glycero-alpha-D-manno-heptose-7-phosphate kinase
MRLSIFTITESESLRLALQRIDENCYGTIFVVNENGSVVGLATDGDIRRYLISGGSLDDSVIKCANRKFVWENPRTPREILLKHLDHRIRVIPLLDENRCLVDVVSRDYMPIKTENRLYARARAPVRISFGGGGSDLTHFFYENGDGAVINTTITLFSHASLHIRKDSRVVINSLDIKETISADDLSAALKSKGRFGLILALLKLINPNFGFQLNLHSDFPLSSGLGGSAVVSAAILGCFNQLRSDQWDLHELAEIAYQAERHTLSVAGGWQDQYATVFGGFNFMEFRRDQNVIQPLRIHRDTRTELEECLILCDTGTVHDSGNIHDDQKKEMSSENVREMVKENVQISFLMRNHLLRGNLLEFGKLLDKAWHLKRRFSGKISTNYLDSIYSNARTNGAIGGKLLGAGGGGFFIFYVPPASKLQLIQHIEASGLKIWPFQFDSDGLQSWKVRECKNVE